MPGTWTAPATTPGIKPGNLLLLTDGTVLAQDGTSAHWWRLTPDARGQYTSGTWGQVASAATERQYYASAVLRDGRVLVAGGEYTTDPTRASDSKRTELYDPVRDRWLPIDAPAGWNVIGDAPCCVLPDGQVLLGNIETGACAMFDPARRHFTATGTKRNRSASEESWTLLPDGSVLTADCTGHPGSERWVNGGWQDAGPVPNDLVEAVSIETGPALLLPDGRVFAVGATGRTSYYVPGSAGAAGRWVGGPDLPRDGAAQLMAKDAPACLLPSGRVLLALSHVDGSKGDYGNASLLFEFDGNQYTPVTTPTPISYGAYNLILLLLPNGQAMLSKPDGFLFYAPEGAPQDSWRPTTTQAPRQIVPGAAYAVFGTQFNGMSQACAYGDDVSNATNYPLVRLHAAQGDAIRYCRSFNHSTMGVATGSAACSTRFRVPDDLVPGDYFLSVVANGIASAETPVTVQAGIVRTPQGAAAEDSADAEEVLDVISPDADTSAGETLLQREMFWRDLNEVHLLMEFIQGRSDKSLTSLTGLVRLGSTAIPPATMTPNEVVYEISKIRFPPRGSEDDKARQAELLLMAKDKLNGIAAPARGLSVAYTSMFAGVGMPPAKGSLEEKVTVKGVGAEVRKQVSGYALEAYPNLTGHARRFQSIFRDLPGWTLLWLVVTAAVYWDVAFSADVLKKALPIEGTICVQNKDAMESVFVTHWRLHPVGWFMHEYGASQPMPWPPCPPTPAKGESPPQPTADQPALVAIFSLANSVIAVASSYVVPMMFGFLGTLAGLMRSISAKVRDSTLSPRDYLLSLSMLPLGAVAGLAVGLFPVATSQAGGPAGSAAASGVSQALPLGAAGVAFLAGYGAEAFFNMMDTLLKRVFPSNTTPTTGNAP